MTLPYLFRLVCLSLATFAGANLAAILIVRFLTARAIRRVDRSPARRAAQGLLFLRFFPAGFALFCVIGLCIPSYVWLEPHTAEEGVGITCLLAAALGVAMWAVSLQRSASAPAVRELARRLGVEVPICEAVDAILAGEAQVEDAVRGLLARPLRDERLEV